MPAMKITFCCTGTDADPWLQELRAALPHAEVSAWAPGAPAADYAVVWAPTQQFLDEQTSLRAIFNIGAGVDALLQLRLPAHIPLVRLNDAGMAAQMAEYITHAVVRHSRELARYETDMRQGQWEVRAPVLRQDWPVGIMGLGVLGARTAQVLCALDFPVRGWSRCAKSIPGVTTFAGTAELSPFLQGTRILVNLLPLTAHTENIIRRETLAQLLPGAYVINVARGAHVVDEDLVAMIQSGHVAGATLDVFRQEPLPHTHPFWHLPQISMTPHISARTLRSQSIAQIVDKIAALARGDAVAGLVDTQRGY